MSQKRLTAAMLTDEQKGALEYIKEFIKGPNREMILRGAAGTGKTSIVNVLLAEIDQAKKRGKFFDYICTATTNKAVEVIARNTGREYDRTIYSLVGLTVKDDDDRGERIVREPGSESKLKNYDLIVVDEASMLPRQVIAEIEYDLIMHSRPKVLYIGDPCQLPPVEDKKYGFNESAVFGLPLWVELRQVMRTALENPILKLVTLMRQDMTLMEDAFSYDNDILEDGSGVRFYNIRALFLKEMMDRFLSEEYKKDTDYCMAVCWRNTSVKMLNLYIRKRIYPGLADEYAEGEEVRVKMALRRKAPGKADSYFPVYNKEERLKILEVDDQPDPVYGLECWKVKVLNFRALPKNQTTTDAFILKSSSVEAFNLLLTQTGAECKEREKELGSNGKPLYTHSEAFKPYKELKNYYLWVDYIYAMTTHKAQGTTIQNVFVVERDLNENKDINERNKLKYTAFTRAAQELHVLI